MPTTSPRPRVLFLCTGNSCRSQIAEGYARALKQDVMEPFSAGIVAHGLNPLALRVMAEDGIDISRQHSKTLASLLATDVQFDLVYTVCGHADENCPVFRPPTRVIHKGFDDPPRLAAGCSTDEEALTHYRRVRDEIRAWIITLDPSPGKEQ